MYNIMEHSNENAEKGPQNVDAHVLHKAVLLITFNRLHYLKEVFAAIAKARPPRLYLASDGARESVPGEKEKVTEIRAWLLAHVDWPCVVKTRFLEKNSGSAGKGVSSAVTWFFQHEKDGIVFEEDCLPTQTFFRYCEECLDWYADDKRIWHITGMAPVDVESADSYYFAKVMHCWGWASWADRWLPHFTLDLHDIGDDVYAQFSKRKYVQDYWRRIVKACNDGTVDTWDYQWTTTIVAHGGLCINATRNLVSNIGVEGMHYSAGGGGYPLGSRHSSWSGSSIRRRLCAMRRRSSGYTGSGISSRRQRSGWRGGFSASCCRRRLSAFFVAGTIVGSTGRFRALEDEAR